MISYSVFQIAFGAIYTVYVCSFFFFATFTQFSKLFVNDAWNDLFEAHTSYHILSGLWNCIHDLRKVEEAVDATSMHKKIEETEEKIKFLQNFQPEVDFLFSELA